jgi:hypothetical protein
VAAVFVAEVEAASMEIARTRSFVATWRGRSA